MNTLQGKRVLVTGASGFIGNRLIERLVLEHGTEVVALVHQYRNASRLARFPLRIIHGDVADAASVKKSAEGCFAIVHAAVSFSGSAAENRRVTVEGARNVCEAAKATRARLVHFSTISVYGETAPGLLDENTPKNPNNDAYGSSKLEAELLVQQYQRQGVLATILQPTVVYGPWSFWSAHTARQLIQGDVVLPDNGGGICNAVYVDDVVDAVFLALEREQVAHGPFLISALKPVTWRDYYSAHATAFPGAVVTGMTNEELSALIHKASAPRKSLVPEKTLFHLKGLLGEVPCLLTAYRGIKRLIKKPIASSGKASRIDKNAFMKLRPRVLPYAEHLKLFQSKTEFQIHRAQNELGYEAKYDLARGGELTAEWLRWSNFAASVER